MQFASLLGCLVISVGMSARADWLDPLRKQAESLMIKLARSASSAALSDEEIVRGRKEALAQKGRQAVARLGKPGGYRIYPRARIPMPEALHEVGRCCVPPAGQAG